MTNLRNGSGRMKEKTQGKRKTRNKTDVLLYGSILVTEIEHFSCFYCWRTQWNFNEFMYRFLSVYLNESYLGQGSLSLIDYMILESKSEIILFGYKQTLYVKLSKR